MTNDSARWATEQTPKEKNTTLRCYRPAPDSIIFTYNLRPLLGPRRHYCHRTLSFVYPFLAVSSRTVGKDSVGGRWLGQGSSRVGSHPGIQAPPPILYRDSLSVFVIGTDNFHIYFSTLMSLRYERLCDRAPRAVSCLRTRRGIRLSR